MLGEAGVVGEPLHLVDDIYEAAAVPEQWPRVLAALAALVDGMGAGLFSVPANRHIDGARERYICTPSMEQVVADFAALGRPEMNQRSPRAIALRHPGFITDHDGFTEDELRTDPFYAEFLRPRGLGWCAGSAIFVPGGDTLVLSIEREYRRGPVSAAEVATLDTLRPHLARAAAFSARLSLERVQVTTQALGLLGLPAAVLGMRHQMIAANALFDAMVPHVFRDGRDRLSLVNAAADQLLADALMRSAARAGGAVQSIPLPATEERAAMVVHVLPVRGAAHDVFAAARTIVLATPVTAGPAPGRELLEGLFDLTPAEAAVAQGIGLGRTVEEIAAAQGAARETVRTHLRHIFAKTGVHRQAELVHLLGGMWHFEA